MDPSVAWAVLGAALLHASWHALVKTSGDGVIALAGMNLVSGVMAVVLLPFVRMPSGAAFAVILFSICLHGAYKVALGRLYAHADLSVGYPLARGMTPLIATAFAAAFISERPSLQVLTGTLLVSLGVSALFFEARAARVSSRAVVAAMGVGAAVAAYSVVDAYGIRIDGDWIAFTAWLVAADSAFFVAYALAMRGRAAPAAWRGDWRRTLASGCLGTVSFGVLMWALARAPVGAVTALRETSVVFAALIGMIFLRERASAPRLVAAVLVAMGATIIALGR